MSLKSLLSTPGAEQLRAWRKLSASEKPWRQMRVREAVSGGISTEEIRMKFSVDTDTRVLEMLTFEGTLYRRVYIQYLLYPERIRVLRADVGSSGEWGHCDRVPVKSGEVVTASSVFKTLHESRGLL